MRCAGGSKRRFQSLNKKKVSKTCIRNVYMWKVIKSCLRLFFLAKSSIPIFTTQSFQSYQPVYIHEDDHSLFFFYIVIALLLLDVFANWKFNFIWILSDANSAFGWHFCNALFIAQIRLNSRYFFLPLEIQTHRVGWFFFSRDTSVFCFVYRSNFRIRFTHIHC